MISSTCVHCTHTYDMVQFRQQKNQKCEISSWPKPLKDVLCLAAIQFFVAFCDLFRMRALRCCILSSSSSSLECNFHRHSFDSNGKPKNVIRISSHCWRRDINFASFFFLFHFQLVSIVWVVLVRVINLIIRCADAHTKDYCKLL